MFTKSLYWAKVSQSIAGPYCSLVIPLLLVVPDGKRKWRPGDPKPGEGVQQEKLASAHLSRSEAEKVVAAGGILCKYYASHGMATYR